MECPRCPSIPPTHRLSGGRVRVECSKCGRLLGYSSGIPLRGGEGRLEIGRQTAVVVQVDEPAAGKGPVSNPPTSAEPASAEWLYVSRRLELFIIPNSPPFNVPLFTMQPEPPPIRGAHLDRPPPPPPVITFYRLTPATLAWFERMADHFESEYLAGRQPREQMDEVCRLMGEVWGFAEGKLDASAVRAARVTGGGLPERGDAVVVQPGGTTRRAA